MHYSLGEGGKPTGDAAYDYSIIMTHFWFMTTNLNEEEQEKVLNCFDASYRISNENERPTNLELSFALVDRWMTYAYSALFYGGELTSNELQTLLDRLVKELRKIMQNNQTILNHID